MEFVAVGFAVVDTVVSPDGSSRMALGGTVVYGGLAALRHGARVLVVSLVGEDFPDEYVLFMARSGLDLTYVRRHRGPTTKFKLVYRDGERCLYLLSRGPDIGAEHLPDSLEGAIAFVGAVAGEVSPSTLVRIAEEAEAVSLDLQGYLRRVGEGGVVELARPAGLEVVVRACSVVHADEREAEVATGSSSPSSAARELVEMGCDAALVTMGEEGSYVATEGEVLYVPAARPERVVDSTGAGDVFTAIFSVEYYRSGDLLWASAMASAASSFLVEEPGLGGLVDRKRVEERANSVLEEIARIG